LTLKVHKEIVKLIHI